MELVSGCQWLSVGVWSGLGAWRTLRRRPQSIRRISTVSADRGRDTRRWSKPQSAASWSWYSNSEADLMLISRKRANSFELLDPHPSTMLKAIDSAAVVIWDLSDPRSLRGNFRTPRLTPSTSSCARLQTNSRRKSCMQPFSHQPSKPPHRFPSHQHNSSPSTPLTTTDNSPTDQLQTQNLHPLSQSPNSPPRISARMQ